MSEPMRPLTPEIQEHLSHKWALHHVRGLAEQAREGDPLALLEVIRHCALSGIRTPHDLALRFSDAIRAYQGYQHRTLDEAIGLPPRPKGMRIADHRNRHTKVGPVGASIQAMHNTEGMPIDEAMRRVAKQYSISFALARDWYYEWREDYEQRMNRLLGEDEPAEPSK